MSNILNPIAEEDNLNTITNDLLLKYDQKFNDYYDKINFLNSSIMNKEEIIMKTYEYINYENIVILCLKYGILLVFLIGILFISYGLKKIKLNIFIIGLVVLIILYIIIIYFNINKMVAITNFEKTLRNLKVNMLDYVNDKLENSLRSCPSDCTTEENNSGNGNGNGSQLIKTYQQPTLKTDNQDNVWKYGDIPADLYTSNKINPSDFYQTSQRIPKFRNTQSEIDGDEANSFFGTNANYKTYYECKWNGTGNGGLPNNENSVYTTIPCNYRPNFTENARHICNSDPNNGNYRTAGCTNISTI
jgi:hypothetical protein